MPRRRAVRVCTACHGRKIRCDVDATGFPCSKCVELGDPCVLRARKPYSGARTTSSRPRGLLVQATNSRSRAATLNLDHSRLVAAALPPGARTTSLYAGDGGYAAILDLLGNTNQRHFQVPAAAETALAAADLEYLKIKGCFSLPAESEMLVRAYFHFVHPSFPLVDGPAFLRQYSSGGLDQVNLLLLWSMFSVSASYVSLPSRKLAKESFVQRAKLLFDLSQEKNKMILVQSALLLSFWFADAEDLKQSWYWSGIAFSIAQTLGLHRSLDSAHPPPEPQQRILWQTVWQCCMLRDVWLAFGMGRPLRIHHDDCSSSSTTTTPAMSADSTCWFLQDLVLDGEPLYTPAEATAFGNMWQGLVMISDVLREALCSKNKLSPSLARALEARVMSAEDGPMSTLLLTVVSRYFSLHKNAALIAISRFGGIQEGLHTAVSQTTSILAAFLGDDHPIYAAPTTIPLIVPSMITYLMALKSNKLSQQLDETKLEVYSKFLTAVEENYPAATIVKKLLAAAYEQIQMSHTTPAIPSTDPPITDTIHQQLSSSWGSEWPGGLNYALWSSD